MRDLRVSPHSLDAEQAVLGGLMLSPEKIESVSTMLAEGDFYTKAHRCIFRAMLEMSARGQPCDAVTMAEWFESAGLSEVTGGRVYCVELSNSTPSAANITAYAQIVREKSVLRQVIDQSYELAELAYGSETSGVSLVDKGIADLMAMQKIEVRNEFGIRQAMTLAYEEAQRAKALGGKVPGISTGLSRLDRILGGWHDSDLVVIGARPAMGKTALLLNFLLSGDVPCGIVSAEQPVQQIGARLMSIDSRVPAERMRNGQFEVDDLRRLEGTIGRLVTRTCQIYDRSAPTIADVSRMARKWKQQFGIKVLFVDYIQRIEASSPGRNSSKAERVGEVVRGLKNLARDLGIPVVALAQVGRQVDSRDDKQPGMADLSDSSEIEKEADQVLTLLRPVVYDESADAHEAIISVEKNRHGPTGLVRCVWLPETMKFGDLA